MFDFSIEIHSSRNYERSLIHLVSDGQALARKWSIPEDAALTFHVVLRDSAHSWGAPKVYIVDVPVFMESSESSYEWFSTSLNGDSKPFTNYSGQSELFLFFPDINNVHRFTIDVLATAENARYAEEMLNVISEQYDDVVNICFSRTLSSGASDIGNSDSFSRVLAEAERCIIKCEQCWPELSRKIRETWEPNIHLISGGLPDSPESIYWLSSNNEQIQYCSPEQQSFSLNGFPVKVGVGAVQKVSSKRDLYENKVIHGFLFHLADRLIHLKTMLLDDGFFANDTHSEFIGYFNLDHVIAKFKKPILDRVNMRLCELEKRCRKLISAYSLLVGECGIQMPIHPEITPFVARTEVYYLLFEVIDSWYRKSSARLDGVGDFLFGLRNLYKLYELTLLVKINKAFLCLNYSLLGKEWRDYSKSTFGGVVSARPDTEPYNYFKWASPQNGFELELFYEPRIWTIGNANPGDPVNVSRDGDDYSDYYRTPDFFIKIHWVDSGSVDVVIFDAKYSSGPTVDKYSLPELVRKYLLGLHILGDSGRFGRLPVNAVWALYPKGNMPRVNYYSKSHSFGGKYDLLPSVGGMLVKPKDDFTIKMLFEGVVNKLKTTSIDCQAKH